jgi:3-oxoacyl-(acyl-carrier-protein) synthase
MRDSWGHFAAEFIGIFAVPTEGCDPDCIPNTGCEADVEYALSNSFGLGGINAAVVLQRHDGVQVRRRGDG